MVGVLLLIWKNILKNIKQVKVSYKLSRLRTEEKWLFKWERNFLDKAVSEIILGSSVDGRMVAKVQEFLGLRSLHLARTLKNMGVRLK